MPQLKGRTMEILKVREFKDGIPYVWKDGELVMDTGCPEEELDDPAMVEFWINQTKREAQVTREKLLALPAGQRDYLLDQMVMLDDERHYWEGWLEDLEMEERLVSKGTKWAVERERYLYQWEHDTWLAFWAEGTLKEYLEGIEQRSLDMEQRLLAQMLEREGLEELKKTSFLECSQLINNCKARVREIVNSEIIYS
jgi:hypothetical protein